MYGHEERAGAKTHAPVDHIVDTAGGADNDVGALAKDRRERER